MTATAKRIWLIVTLLLLLTGWLCPAILSLQLITKDPKAGDAVQIGYTVTAIFPFLYRKLQDESLIVELKSDGHDLKARTQPPIAIFLPGVYTGGPFRPEMIETLRDFVSGDAKILWPSQKLQGQFFLNDLYVLNQGGAYQLKSRWKFLHSQPLNFEVANCLGSEMNAHIRALLDRLPHAIGSLRSDTIRQLIYTGSSTVIPTLIQLLYDNPQQTPLIQDALLSAFPRELVLSEILRTGLQRGLTPVLIEIADRTDNHWTKRQWEQIKSRSSTNTIPQRI